MVQRAIDSKNSSMFSFINWYNGSSIILEMIHLSYVTNGVYLVYFKTKVLGKFIMQDDGYYGYYTAETSGYWSSYALRGIADALDEINKEWDGHLKENLK